MIESLKLTPAYDIYRFFQERKTYEEWEREGIPVPPPAVVKQHTVKTYAKRFSLGVMVETGTYLGEMVRATKDIFERIISVEIDERLAKRAQKKFSKYDHITIFRGDSGEVIKEILPSIKIPCLFWLDSHYSGGLTSHAGTETPIMKELGHIFSHDLTDHVILIDDARNFTGENDYPELEALRDFVLKQRPGWNFEVKHDIIRIHPQPSHGNDSAAD